MSARTNPHSSSVWNVCIHNKLPCVLQAPPVVRRVNPTPLALGPAHALCGVRALCDLFSEKQRLFCEARGRLC